MHYWYVILRDIKRYFQDIKRYGGGMVVLVKVFYFLSDKRIYNVEKASFNNEIKMEIKTTTTAALRNELKYSPMSEGNTRIVEPNLEVLLLR